MSWLTKLCETYDYASDIIGIDNEGLILLPIAHSTQNAQVDVILDYEGNFLRAGKIEKEDSVTLIPVTEDSASRSSGIAPHPLCDKLVYVAGDYDDYVETKKPYHGYYEKYMENLKKWVDSIYCNRKLQAVYQYLEKGCLMEDLTNQGILVLGEDRKAGSKEKIAGIAQTDSFVRFSVEQIGVTDGKEGVWKDPEMYQSFINYYLQSVSVTDLCYASGQQTYCSDKHPSKVRNTADKSKLISANDTSGFSFRGRFDKKEEANSVGYEASQKAHNALKWLIKKRQGFSIGDMCFVAWGVQNTEIPDVAQDTQSIWDDEAWGFDAEEELPEKNTEVIREVDTSKAYVERLKRAVFCDEKRIDTEDNMVFMMLEAATTGRLSITYYKELTGSRFYENLLSWHSSCSWKHTYKYIDGKCMIFVGAPALRDIIRSAYGVDQNGMLTVKDNVEKSTVQRLLPCVIEGKRIPFDIVTKLLYNASSPMRYSHFNSRKILSIACAVIRKYYNDKKNGTEEWDMALQEERPDRDYLYGRLLAWAQRAERMTFKDSERDTNAERYMSAFQKHPYTTWPVIYKRLTPYFKSLNNHGDYFKNEISKIIDQFEPGDFENNHALNGTFLLGYSSQLNAPYKKKEKEEEK